MLSVCVPKCSCDTIPSAPVGILLVAAVGVFPPDNLFADLAALNSVEDLERCGPAESIDRGCMGGEAMLIEDTPPVPEVEGT